MRLIVQPSLRLHGELRWIVQTPGAGKHDSAHTEQDHRDEQAQLRCLIGIHRCLMLAADSCLLPQAEHGMGRVDDVSIRGRRRANFTQELSSTSSCQVTESREVAAHGSSRMFTRSC